ncbi:unnamed protein product [Moneuplotes crassus]|uniref:PX domain-containing protein n=1 Tax=Euplotes crassus TaxID=5936 RepID=A0AAD1X9D0_EUPCR|nr:unnamed protein product [Moneuplotes crassus]
MEQETSPKASTEDQTPDPQARAQKQKFLLENIVNPGYKKELFAAYIADKRENGGDIDNWSLEELKEVVYDFQNSYEVSLNSDENNDSYEIDYHESPELFGDGASQNCDSQNVNSELSYTNDSNSTKHPVEEDQKISTEISKHQEGGEQRMRASSMCDIEDTTRISDLTAFNKVPDHSITITDAVHNSGGLFSFSYVEYYIETQPFGWNVKRREQDFQRLRNYLLKKFPQFVIPPLIQNKLFEMQSDKETKKVYFQEFLREVSSNPELCACKFLEEFLSITDYEGFKEVRRLREKEPAPKSLKEYTNIKGIAKLTIKCQNIKTLDHYDKFFINKYEQILKDLRTTSNQIHMNALNLADSIKKFTLNLDTLSELFQDCGFTSKVQFYEDLKSVTKTYEESVIQQAETLVKELDLSLNFQILQANSFREFHKHKEEVDYELHKFGNDLLYKKDQLWNSREKPDTHKKWKLNKKDLDNISKLLENEALARTKMLPKETHFYWDKSNQFKHLQHRSLKEIERCNDVLGSKLQKLFNKISAEQLKIVNKLHVSWGDYLGEYIDTEVSSYNNTPCKEEAKEGEDSENEELDNINN